MPDRNQSSRRDFLRGKLPDDSITQADKECDQAHPIEAEKLGSRQAAYLEQYSKNAMACEFEIFFNLHQYRQSGIATASAFQLIDAIEDQMTVYRSHSEVSQINRMPKGKTVELEEHLFEVIWLGCEIHRETGGAFDLTAAPLTRLWRFDQRSGQIPARSEIEETLTRVGSHLLDLDAENQTLCFLQDHVEINLGGIGKGHALDRVAADFHQVEMQDFVIHGGQSSVLAAGSSVELKSITADVDDEATNQGWRVGISHPTLPGKRLAEATLRNRALGTSGTARQAFFHRGQRFGHIIDPRTGWPTNHILSSTVVTSSAARADALATAFFVMQPEEVESYCRAHPGTIAVLVVPGKAKGRIEILLFGEWESTIAVL